MEHAVPDEKLSVSDEATETVSAVGESDSETKNGTEVENATESGTLSLRRIRRILNESRDAAERRQAVRQLVPRLWDPFPWQRYQAGCVLTTRVYLPSTLFVLEWGSFPNVLSRELRASRNNTSMTAEAQREMLRQTLGTMLTRWFDRSVRLTGGKRGESAINMDIAADVCEAIGRLGIAEAEADLLDILRYFRADSNQVRSTTLVALAALPPEQLRLTWGWLQEGTQQERRLIGSALAYMTLPGAVPFLLAALPKIASDSDLQQSVGIPLLTALGRIGDPRALPDLNAIARAEAHPLQPTARKAIQRIMKEAEGHEEVTLVRASGAASLQEDVLLRPSAGRDSLLHPEQLLRVPVAECQPASTPSEKNNAQEEQEYLSNY